MKSGFVLTPSASRDLDEIIEYVLEHAGVDADLSVHQQLYDGMPKVGARPGIGHVRNDLANESLRVWTVFSYLVVYRPATDPVQIIRVVHGARDVPRVLRDEG